MTFKVIINSLKSMSIQKNYYREKDLQLKKQYKFLVNNIQYSQQKSKQKINNLQYKKV